VTLTEFAVILLYDIFLIVMAVKTKVYVEIITVCKKIFPFVTMVFIVLAPLCFFISIVHIYNAFTAVPVENAAVQAANERNIPMDLKEFGFDCILSSPMFFLVMCFLLQALFFMKSEENEDQNIEKMQTEMRKALLRFKISLITNNLTILIGVSFLFLEYHFKTNLLRIDFIYYIRDFSFSGIYSEELIRIAIIIFLGVSYYYGIFSISNWYIEEVMNNNEDKKQKLWKYKLLTFCFPVNLCVIPLLQREVKEFGKKCHAPS